MNNITICNSTNLSFPHIKQFTDNYLFNIEKTQIRTYFYLLIIPDHHTINLKDIENILCMSQEEIFYSLNCLAKIDAIDLVYNNENCLTEIIIHNLEEIPLKESVEKFDLLQANTKPSITPDELDIYKNNKYQLLCFVKSKLHKKIQEQDIVSLYYITEILNFSSELVEYLIQHCVLHGKRNFKYIEKVAIDWKKHGLTNPGQIKMYYSKYNKNILAIMMELKKSVFPTPTELEFVKRWINEYNFKIDIILEACKKTALVNTKKPYEYTNSILVDWKNHNIQSKKDIIAHEKANKSNTNSFNNFEQNNYDFDSLEKEILSN